MSTTLSEPESAVKQRIFRKFMGQLAESCEMSFCPELNPDVIVIPADQSFLFEPQNLRVVEWLHRQFGMENLGVRERIHVHPSRCQMVSKALRSAGFEMSGWI